MRTHTAAGVAAVVLSIAAVAGCGGPSQSTVARPTTTTPTAVSSTTTATSSLPPLTATTVTALGATAVTNERNNLVKHLGELAGLNDANKVLLYTFSLDQVSDCTSEGKPNSLAPGMHRIVARMTIRTTTAFPLDQGYEFNSTDFHMIGPDGKATGEIGPAGTWDCVPAAERLPAAWQRATNYSVGVTFESPYQHGQLVLVIPGQDGGWEWTI